eukprot:TRINITY_DN4156_c0_g1_i1.p1 TRINITY_DN4156_c0_g1~~TRINITY_DN4156_c0_g1_i1.p1  ORF type:complete len:752 (-),score=258.48 TRINITY_DN4156_c0_g1_i1:543-2798(-)
MKRGKAPTSTKPSEHFENEWRRMETAFDRLLAFVDSGYKKPQDSNQWIKENMEAYACVYNLCTKNDGAKSGANSAQILYQRAKVMVERYLAERVTRSVLEKKGDDLLSNVYNAWNQHQLVVKWARFMFRYLDDYYTKQQNIDNLRVMILKCFNTAVYENIKNDLCAVILEQVLKERDGLTIDRGVLKEAIGLFVEMGMDSINIYEKDFQHPFLMETAQYYRRTAAAWWTEPGGNRTYLRRVETALNQENQRALAYLHGSSLTPVISCVEKELLGDYLTRVLEDVDAGTAALLVNWKVEDLGRMFQLFKRVSGGLDAMSAIVREYIKKEGKEINKKFCDGEKDGNAYIDLCLELHDKYSGLFRENFEGNAIFHKARKDAYEVFVNETLQAKGEDAKQPTKVTSSELLSTYCDNLMKNEKITPDELEEKLDKVVQLFTYISDKDLFQEFYRKQMSKRLIVSKTDNDNERQLISKLKMKMGAPYTSKLEGMIVDKGMGAETHKAFTDFLRQQGKELKVEFQAQVLTTGFWPHFKIDPLNPPPELALPMRLFKEYYDKTTQSRILKWVHSLGTATVNAKFRKGPKEMIVSTFQACVLLTFNAKEETTPGELARELDLPMDEMKRTIHSLTFGKFEILAKDGEKKKTFTEDDVFRVNEDFQCPQRKFKVPNIIKTIGDPVEKTDETRRHVIEACVVRVMKSRKQLTHSELQAETIKQLSHLFKPDPKVIKKRIEDLIQRKYLERDETDRTIYRYLA